MSGDTAHAVARRRRLSAWWPVWIAIIATAAALRLMLAHYSLWFDEIASLYFASQPLTSLWSDWMIVETNPPLFYTLLKGWVALGADTVVTLRLLPIAGGLGQVALLGFLAHRWLGTRAAVIAMFLAALAPQNIYFSHQLRGYIFAVDGVLLSTIGLLLIADAAAPRRRLGWGLHVTGSVLAMYSHTTMFLWPVIATLWFLLIARADLPADRWRLLRQLILATALIAAAGVWWVYISYLQIHEGLPNLTWNYPMGPRDFARRFADASLLGWDRYDRPKLLTNLVGICTLIAAAWTWRDQAARRLTILFGMSLAIFCLVGMKQPIIVQRTVFWMSIFPTLLIAAWLGSSASALLRWGMVTVIAVLLLGNLRRDYPKFEQQRWTDAVRTVAAHPNSILVVQGATTVDFTARVCALEFGSPICPFRIVALPIDPAPELLHGGARRKPAATAIARRLTPDGNAYAMYSYTFHPARGLNPLDQVTGRRSGEDTRFFIGPIPRATLLRMAD